MFAKCVLRQQPEIRGGKKKKLRRNETLCAALLERVKRWNDGKVDELWSEARKLYPAGIVRVATFAELLNALKMLAMEDGGCSALARYVSYERRYAQGDAI